jgi:hypothetical protein
MFSFRQPQPPRYIWLVFFSGGIILGSPLSCTDLFLYIITLPAVSCEAPPTLSLELASRVLLSSKKSAHSKGGLKHTHSTLVFILLLHFSAVAEFIFIVKISPIFLGTC